MNAFRERKLYSGLVIISVLMVVLGLYAYAIPEQQKREADWVTHTHHVQNQIETLSNDLTTAETSQRGYLLTGQSAYLDPYTIAIRSVERDLKQVQSLTRDNALQQARIPGLRAHITARIAQLQETIDLRRSSGADAALRMVRSGRGRTEMAVIERKIDLMQSEEERLLNLRNATWNAAVARTRRIFLCGVILLYVMLCAVYAVMQKQVVHRKRLLEAERCATNAQREEAERLAKIVSLQRDIAFTRQDLQTMMQTITERTQEITCAEGGVVELVEGDELVCRAATGIMAPLLGLRLNFATSLSGRCVQENVLFRCDDTETDDRVDKAACRKIGLRSMVVVPLRHSGQAIGVLKVLSARPDVFTTQDVASLELMAGVLSAAISDATATDCLRASQERLEEAQQVAHVGSWEFDCATNKITWSKELFRLTGIAPEQGEPDYAAHLALYTPDSAACLDASVQQAMRDGIDYALDLQVTSLEGEIPRWFHAVGKPVRDTHGTVIRLAGTLLDITERKRHARDMQAANEWLVEANTCLEVQKAELGIANARLEALATTDGLTGLKNHRAFQERPTEEVQRAERSNRPLSIVLLDVDHFKLFNDTFGHPEGDTALRKVAEILQAIARTTDLVARYGGEEFVLLLPETDVKGAVKIAERIRHAIAKASWKRRAITVSVGAATFNLQTRTGQKLVDLADRALYHSKRRGRDRVTHASELAVFVADLNDNSLNLNDERPRKFLALSRENVGNHSLEGR